MKLIFLIKVMLLLSQPNNVMIISILLAKHSLDNKAKYKLGSHHYLTKTSIYNMLQTICYALMIMYFRFVISYGVK